MIEQKRYRYPTWWWGRWIQWDGKKWRTQNGEVFPELQVNLDEFELYDEETHGAHNENRKDAR